MTKPEPIYFWKPEAEHGYLGQWYPSVFTSTGPDGKTTTYENAEQYMMHGKALLFAPDSPVTAQIMVKPAPSPKKIKALGQQVPDFDQATWEKERYGIVLEGTYLKFSQNKELKEQLLATGKKELVEASPRDRIWGVGFGANNAGKMRQKWGLNLLGKALMEVRERLADEAEEEGEDGLAEGETEVLGEREGEGGRKRKIEGLIKGVVGKKARKDYS